MDAGQAAARRPANVSSDAEMTLQSPELPSTNDYQRLGVSHRVELHAGKQSRCFSAVLDGQKVVVKLTDRRLTDPAILRAKMRAVETVGGALSAVVMPIRVAGDLVQPIGEWLMTATPFVTGDRLDISTPHAGRVMGQTLARLHEVMAELPVVEIPPVAALESDLPSSEQPSSEQPSSEQPSWQLLHGDFSYKNLIASPTGLRIFDFDDCGYGPTEYDLANSLYMVLFDSEVNDSPSRYETFRPSFLGGYSHSAAKAVDAEPVDEMIRLRIAALGRWLEDLPNAPIGIQTSSPEWLETLESFVASHRWGKAP
ncbi:MAG: phosphotransferase [Actinobacteria bacterium]|nr:phosphotransferase [Actinomycetota bacterium]